MIPDRGKRGKDEFDATDRDASVVKQLFACVDETYAAKVTSKQSNPNFISDSRMTRLIVDSQTLSTAAASRKRRLSAAASI
jgi:hypothetical protein